MNFIRLYIGDYMRDTGTLTVAEHGAYVLMLLHHYGTEQPLPTGRELHRLLRAESKADRDAIDNVTRRFWTETETGLINTRAGKEMARAEHQRDVNRTVGKLGGRPKRKETESQTESVTHSLTESKPNANPNQTPDTREKTKPPKPTVSPPLCPAGVDPGVWADWLTLRKAKRAPVTPTVLEGAVAEAGKAGMTLDAFLRAWCNRGSQGLEADWLKPHERPQQQANGHHAEPAWRTEQRARNEAFLGPAAAKRHPTTIDAEATHAAPDLLA